MAHRCFFKKSGIRPEGHGYAVFPNYLDLWVWNGRYINKPIPTIDPGGKWI